MLEFALESESPVTLELWEKVCTAGEEPYKCFYETVYNLGGIMGLSGRTIHAINVHPMHREALRALLEDLVDITDARKILRGYSRHHLYRSLDPCRSDYRRVQHRIDALIEGKVEWTVYEAQATSRIL